jgi:hypothetical protein
MKAAVWKQELRLALVRAVVSVKNPPVDSADSDGKENRGVLRHKETKR